MNAYTRTVLASGAVIETWVSVCKDCGAETGHASVRRPDGTGESRHGAACGPGRERRTLNDALAWVLTFCGETP